MSRLRWLNTAPPYRFICRKGGIFLAKGFKVLAYELLYGSLFGLAYLVFRYYIYGVESLQKKIKNNHKKNR